jgi:autonomous glycyl radical cofactor GrcA
VRAVVAISVAGIPEIRRIADEVVAAILEVKDAQVERRIAVDVPPQCGVPGDTGFNTAVDRMRTLETVSASRRRHGWPLGVRRNRRWRTFLF